MHILQQNRRGCKHIARLVAPPMLCYNQAGTGTAALRFYKKYGFVLAALHRNAPEQARKPKPEIPLVGSDGIPRRDEIELEMRVSEE